MNAEAANRVADMIDQDMGKNTPPASRRFGNGETAHEMAHADRIGRFSSDE